MEVFSVFATLSLVDLISGPLGKIRAAMKAVDSASLGLGQRMGKLALAMGPVALASGVMLGAFGKCVATAAGFEDQIAKVGAVSRATGPELKALEAKARELGATTQFTAVQVGEAEQYLAMAGFSAKQNIDALPGVLNLAAATATDLGRAADISSDILGAFGMEAAEMGRAADVLAMTCATANTNLELLGDTMKYVAPVARTAGLSIEETAAMAGLLGNVGIKGSQAGTTLKAMLNKMAAPSKEATELLQKLGVTLQDQAGNLKSPVGILGELAEKLRGMGSAQQIAAMKTVVGEEAIAGFAELIKKGGTGALVEYIQKIRESGGACDKMAAQMNDTLAGSMRSLGSAWESLQITIGKVFLPVVRAVADALTGLLRLFDQFAQTRVGAAILKIAGTLATAVIAVTAFAAGMWAVTKAAPFVSKVFLGIKTALLGLGAPVWALIALAGLLYAAWRTDFGGIATLLSGWWRKIKLVVRGVIAIFDSLKGSVFTIRGELARDISAAGLENLVINVAKICYRIKEFFSGIWDALNFDGVATALAPAILKIRDLFDSLGTLIGRVFGGEVRSAAADARGLGEILGTFLSWALEGVATVIANVVRGIDTLIAIFRGVIALLTGDWATAAEMGRRIWDNFCDSLMAFADLFRIGDWIRDAWAEATEWLSGINLFDSGMRLIDTLKEGILSAASGLVDSVKGVFQKVRNLLPFSDAREGPLSTLTLSGSRLMTTLSEGVNAGFPSLLQNISGKFQSIRDGLGNWWDSLWGNEQTPEIRPQAPKIPDAPDMPQAVAEAKERQLTGRRQDAAGQTWTVHIANITLPNVQNGRDFCSELDAAILEKTGALA